MASCVLYCEVQSRSGFHHPKFLILTSQDLLADVKPVATMTQAISSQTCMDSASHNLPVWGWLVQIQTEAYDVRGICAAECQLCNYVPHCCSVMSNAWWFIPMCWHLNGTHVPCANRCFLSVSGLLLHMFCYIALCVAVHVFPFNVLVGVISIAAFIVVCIYVCVGKCVG